MEKKKICLIGAGPSGMAMINHWKLRRQNGEKIPDLVCFEKQANWGGQWNFDWRTGLDELGEPVHSAMYHNLWSLGPKELNEFPDYSFDEHFGKAVPAYVPREVIFKYYEAYWNKRELRKHINFGHSVDEIKYIKENDNFEVYVRDLKEKKSLKPITFDYVVTANGMFSLPNAPHYPGMETFPGEILHSHDLRSFQRFKGQNILIIGASWSAEDGVCQLLKYKCGKLVVSSRSLPLGYLGSSVMEKPIVETISGSSVQFKDGSTFEPDAIILATGYVHSLSFMKENPTEIGSPFPYVSNSYKAILSLTEGNGKLFHLNIHDNIFSVPIGRLQSQWILRVINQELNLPSLEEMKQDIKIWNEKLHAIHRPVERKCELYKDVVEFMLDYVEDLNAVVKDKEELRFDLEWAWNYILKDRSNLLTYRDATATSLVTGKRSTEPKIPFAEAFFETDEEFRKLYVD